MTSVKFNRWEDALKVCMASKKPNDKSKPNRWNNDPMALNTEAHELPVEKQRLALDFAEEAPADLRETLAPMWKYCFVQWHIYDAGLQAMDEEKPLPAILKDEAFLADIQSLKTLLESGDLDKASTAEKWSWKMLEPMPEAGSIQPWNAETSAPVLQVSREERRDGVSAFQDGRFDKAFWHFHQGLKMVARAPATKTGPHAKLRADLHKNLAAVAVKMDMKKIALSHATAAVSINPKDEKAWYRQAMALEALGKAEEAKAAFVKAGLMDADVGGKEVADKAPGAAERTIVDNYGIEHTFQEQFEPPTLGDELEPLLHYKFESMVFIEMGVNSIAAVDLIMHIKAELPGAPIPLTLIYDCPTAGEVVAELLSKMNTASQNINEAQLRRKMVNTVWRAMTKTLGRDPVKDVLSGRSAFGPTSRPQLMPEATALSVLEDLTKVYESDSWIATTRKTARHVAFEQRSFLVVLRSAALKVQKPVLEASGYEVSEKGVTMMEMALVSAGRKSSRVAEALQSARMALQGGPNGMWAINMESQGDTWEDSFGMQSRSAYLQADPFGQERKNTNSSYGR